MIYALLPLLLFGLLESDTTSSMRKAIDPIPQARREFRGVWIATVDNIDWPSRPGLPAEVQRQELRSLFDRAVQLNLNAVILQIRPAGDALYASAYEPWSYYLTGVSGEPPVPYYDPLAFAVEEAHRRGLELHAWFNPFRARHPSAEGPDAAIHLSNARPDLVRSYGDYLWMDPGEPEVRAHALAVILDVVRRYDIDGVHLDDYFYPYPIQAANGRDLDFPDEPSWQKTSSGFQGTRAAWRRQNVDGFIERLYAEVKMLKPWVKVGISPFGIWRPGYPAQIRGFDAYDRLYADARKWLQEGWLDYLAPQLYWRIDQAAQSYPVLLDWWSSQNTLARHLWPGLYTSRTFQRNDPWTVDELARQIDLTRQSGAAEGHIHFSMKALMPGPARVGPALFATRYTEPALVPASPWLGGVPPSAPEVALEPGGPHVLVSLTPSDDTARWWVVRVERAGSWAIEIVPAWRLRLTLPPGLDGASASRVVVTAVNRIGLESTPIVIAVP